MQYNYSDALQSFIPKLRPKSFQSKHSLLSKIQEFKTKLKNLKSRSSERKVFLAESTKKPVNCSDLGYSYIPAVKNTSSLLKFSSKQELKPRNLLKNNIICLSQRALNKNDKNFITILRESKLIQQPLHRPQKSLIQSTIFIKSRLKKRLREEKPKSEIFQSKNSEFFTTVAMSSVKSSQAKTIDMNMMIKVAKIDPEIYEDDMDSKKQDRVPIILDKLVECNDSIVSSVSSVICERLPRYKLAN